MSSKLPKEHPAYGVIQVSRISSTGTDLFRSPFTHRQFIGLTIREAELNRDYGEDRHYPGKQIIEVYMSETQFGQLLSSHSIGEGVPCTISRRDGKSVEPCPINEFRGRHEIEFDEKIKALHEAVRNANHRVDEILDQKTIKVGDRKEIKDLMAYITRELTQNLPFLLDQYVEKMREVTDAAENEIRSGLVARLQQLGMSKLMEDNLIESPIATQLLTEETESPE